MIDDYCWAFVLSIVIISILFLLHLESLISWVTQ